MIKKYLVTFRNTFLSLIINFISFSILPKSISLSEYGLYQFSISFFSNLRSLFNMASTGGVFQLSSEHNNSKPILNMYAIFLLIQFLLIFMVLFFINILNMTQDIFNSNHFYLILFIGLVEFTNFIFLFLLSYGDAKSLTIEFQRIKTYELALRGFLLISIYYIGILTLNSFLSITFALALISNIVLLKKLSFIKNFSIQKQRMIVFSKKIIKYSLPLAIVEVIAIFYNMADIFLIQSMLGSSTFAVYIYAYKFVMVILIFIQPMFNIFWQYIAKNFEKHLDTVKTIFNELIIIICSLSIIFMFFLLTFSENIILLFADERYLKSAEYLSILSVIVVPLAIEKLAVVVLYATHNTKKYRNIVSIGSLISIFSSVVILGLYKLSIINADKLIWIIMIKIIIYSYILNGYILKNAMDILSINKKYVFKKIIFISTILFIANSCLLFLSFNTLVTFIIFGVLNLLIMIYLLLSFKNKINKIEANKCH